LGSSHQGGTLEGEFDKRLKINYYSPIILIRRRLMYAVVKTGGKEYRVSKGDLIRVEKLEGKVGDQVELKEVLMVSKEGEAQVGTPHLNHVVIKGEIVQESKGKKVLTYKMKRRKNYRRFKGHRQTYTYLKVNDIALS
jgi:large subunit ribosomal protein L21